MVTQPPGHYTDDWKPANHDPHRIFVSPSIKYCSFRDVYTKKKRCVYLNLHLHIPPSISSPNTPVVRFEAGGKQYDGRVCFKVLIKPGFHVSGKTIDHDGEIIIDRNFEDCELEWSANVDRGIYLYGLMIRVDEVKSNLLK
jgi:hypothetical protein